jgi:hypothetical protein
MNSQFKKGDKVIITNPGKTYSTYSDGFRELGFKNPYGNGSFPQGSECVVFGITSHPGSKLTLLGVRDKDGNESLISEDGVVLISSHTSLENEFDIPKIDHQMIVNSKEGRNTLFFVISKYYK